MPDRTRPQDTPRLTRIPFYRSFSSVVIILSNWSACTSRSIGRIYRIPEKQKMLERAERKERLMPLDVNGLLPQVRGTVFATNEAASDGWMDARPHWTVCAMCCGPTS